MLAEAPSSYDKAVLVDFGGVLLNNYAVRAQEFVSAWHSSLAEAGLPAMIVERLRTIDDASLGRLMWGGTMASTATESLLRQSLSEAELSTFDAATFVEFMNARYTEQRNRNRAVAATQEIPFEGMAEVLRRLRALGYAVVGISRKTEENAQAMLDAQGLHDCFTHLISTHHKNKTGADVERALAAAGISDPHHAIFIGDVESDMRAGDDAGVHTFLAGWGGAAEDGKHRRLMHPHELVNAVQQACPPTVRPEATALTIANIVQSPLPTVRQYL